MADLRKIRARPDRLATSILDRLIDDDPDLERDVRITQAETLEGLRESLRRDLGVLLNTRCCPTSPPGDMPDLQQSLMGFGVDDFFNASLVTDQQRRQFARKIQVQISKFETRLEDLNVEILNPVKAGQRSLRLRISATYRARPGMPPMAFETVLDPTTNQFSLQNRQRDV